MTQRTELWFGKYNKCVEFVLNEAGALRKLNHKSIDHTIEVRRAWGQVRQPTQHGGSWANQVTYPKITATDVANLHHFCDFLLNDTRDKRLVITHNTICVYTSDSTLIDAVLDLHYVVRPQLRKIELVGQAGSVRLSQSDYKFRSYFRYARLNVGQATNIKNFLSAQTEIRLSPSLKHWCLVGTWKMCSDYFFIDHNDSGTLSMLGLIAPRLIRKTMPIVTK
jgi:hypothetical protein